MNPCPCGNLTDPQAESSATVRERVRIARERQYQRCGKANAAMSAGETERFCVLQEKDAALLDHAILHLNLSARAYHRVLKLARTIADLNELENIDSTSLTEAVSYRSMDRGQK